MIETLQFCATLCAATFFGAALYINLVEHPARLSLETPAAVAQWAPSYERATLMQAPLALVSTLAALGVWLMGDEPAWLLAGVLIASVVPFTFIVIMPTNRRLLARGRDLDSPETRVLLEKWGRLHAVRSGVSGIAAALMLTKLSGL